MDRTIQLGGRIDQHGKPKLDEPVRLVAWAVAGKGKRFTATFERERMHRSTQANARYWAALVPFAAEVFEQKTGQPFSKDAAHLALKLAFLGHDEMTVGGVLVTVPKSTAKLTVGEFQDYTKRIEAWIEQEFQVKPELIDAEAFV